MELTDSLTTKKNGSWNWLSLLRVGPKSSIKFLLQNLSIKGVCQKRNCALGPHTASKGV